MTEPIPIHFVSDDLEPMAEMRGRVAIMLAPDGRMDHVARYVNKLTKGVLDRLKESGRLKEAKSGEVISIAFPVGLVAEALDVVVLERRPDALALRRAGAALAAIKKHSVLHLWVGTRSAADQVALGLALRSYSFDRHKNTDRKNRQDSPAPEATLHVANPEKVKSGAAPFLAAVEGTHFARDLVNEPANVLTTIAFADRLSRMESLGLQVEVLNETDLDELGMRALLAVGQGSASPSRVVVLHWRNGAPESPPLVLVGKGVTFDTGGISLKPAAGMEQMTMDMGGAAVVAGTMRALAARKARANVIGLVGLVENMPSGTATRPGDVVHSLKGDTIEIVNTDAEGRLVLADVMWYAQSRFNPAALVDIATLTGAIIVGLGHENAGVFSNDDKFCDAFLKAAAAEGEGAWRLPMGTAYDERLKSRIADMKNVGGRPAGAITAAQFLRRFVKPDMPWIHIDIAGVALAETKRDFAPKGATGWGVLALNRLVAERFEV